MAAAVPFLQIAGAAFTAISALQQGRAASQAASYNAAAAARSAAASRDQAAADADAQQRYGRARLGEIRANYGYSGVGGNEGSALDVLMASAAAAETDRQAILYKGSLRAMGYEDTATLDRMQA